MAPPHEGYQRADHPLVSSVTALKFKVVHRPGVQMAVADFLSRNGGGGLQAGGLTGLRRAVGVCGEGSVGRRNTREGERVRTSGETIGK